MENTRVLQLEQISKAQANLADLIRKLDDWTFPDQDFYENYEFEILRYANALAVEDQSNVISKIRFDVEYVKLKSDYANSKDKCSDAEATRYADSQLIDKESHIKEVKATLDMYKDILNSYRRYGEVIKSRLIKDMSDQKRLDTYMRSENQ